MSELKWEDEMGELVCNPVARENGVRYELYNDRTGKAFAVLYMNGKEVVIPFQNREKAKEQCEVIADVLRTAIETGFVRGVEYALGRYRRDCSYKDIQEDIRQALEERQHIPPNPLP